MDRGRGSSSRSGQGGHRSDHVARGGSRTHSNNSSSSGNSSGPSNPNRPTLKPAPTPPHRQQASTPTNQQQSQIDSPPGQAAQQSTFNLNGNTVHETYRASASTPVTPVLPLRHAMTSPRGRGGRSQANKRGERPTPRSPVSHAGYRDSMQCETKIKVHAVSKSCYTKDIHEALSRYGTVVRIELTTGSGVNNAWVVFRPPIPHDVSLPPQIRVGKSSASWEFVPSRSFSIPSPVDNTKSYHETYIIPATAIAFGVQTGESEMICLRTVEGKGIHIMLNLLNKRLDIQFSIDIDKKTRKIRFELPFALLSRVLKLPDVAGRKTSLVLPADSVPQFYVQKKEGALLKNGSRYTSFSRKENQWNDWSTWFRETDLVEEAHQDKLRSMPVMNHKDTAVIDIGRWTHYRIVIDQTTSTSTLFTEFSCALADHGINIQGVNHYTFHESRPSPIWNLLEEEITGTHPHLAPSPTDFQNLFASQSQLPFPVRYQLEACLSNGYIKEYNITEAFLERLAQLDNRCAVAILEKVVDKQHAYYDPMDIFQLQIKGSLVKKVPSYCILQRSAVLTPTMMHVSSPIMETSNRIIRKYAADADRFIRVKFSDEKTKGPLRNMPNDRADALFDRVQRAMNHGIVVAGRYYEFLAFGNSQFREHGAYFYAPTASKSSDDIRVSLGQFDHIRTPAKFGARLGQCFSTTRAMRESVKICEIPDIVRNGYNFSDGVGKLSLFLAQMAAQQLGLSRAFDDPPTLYQFRLGGCKGVLALDPSISGYEVHIRPSQQKFVAEYTGLEIIRSSALATPFFNRQIIIVLSDLGVRDEVFMKKQQEMVNDYELAMTDEKVALQKLQKHIDLNQTTITMAGMVLDGFMRAQEPFLTSLLRLWRACTIKNLKEKARIAVEDGAFVLGCVDETATLKGHFDDPQSRPGATAAEKIATLPEMFLQIDDTSKKGHYKIIQGVCILARNPSLHPGDLRIVRAVDAPALRHLKNVVVFPQTGDRDLANMCSGGDLDGDDYMVLWDKDLIPSSINEPPMDFTAEKPIEKSGPITVGDISEFFVTYMKNDSLGQIAHAHLAQADLKPDGVKDHTCLALANLHSQAVDYPKSGIPAVMDRDLRPAKWPHFMEKKHLPAHKIYKSRNILGQLYDHVQLVDFKPEWDKPFDTRILSAFDSSQDLLRKAAELKVSYDESLRRLMAKHGIRTEFEAWSIFVLQHNHESRDYKFAEEFGRTIGALKSHFRAECLSSVGASSTAEWSQMAPFVAAMYTVTAKEIKIALEECQKTKIVGGEEVPARLKDPEHMPLMSFPWLFAAELGKIANRTNNVRVMEETPFPQPSRPKKVHVNHEPQDIGTVETQTGTTHYGELLNLDFGSKAGNDPTNLTRSTKSAPKVADTDLAVSTDNPTPPSVQGLSTQSNGNSSAELGAKDLEQAVVSDVQPVVKKSSAMDRLKRFEITQEEAECD